MPVAKAVTQHFLKIQYNEGKSNGGFYKTVIVPGKAISRYSRQKKHAVIMKSGELYFSEK